MYQATPGRPNKMQSALLQAISGTAAIAIEQRQLTDQLAYQAHHDALTGMPNRLLFQERLCQAILQARRAGTIVALLYVDLDRFKGINDTLGHGTGDELLRQVAWRLKSCLRETDSLARMSGDEFTVTLTGLKQAEHAELVAELILERYAAHSRWRTKKYLSPPASESAFSRGMQPRRTLFSETRITPCTGRRAGEKPVRDFLPEMGARVPAAGD